MTIRLKDIIELAKGLPEAYFEEAFEKLNEIKEKADSEKESKPAECPHCGSASVARNGKRHGKQAYLCRSCSGTFVETASSAIAHSHSSATVWRQVIRDTVEGVPIDKTAENLDLSHPTVFNMRHKILYAIEQSLNEDKVELTGVCEADETYVLESVKGSKIPEDYHRKPRKHGAKASKRGISNEYVCVCASVTGAGENVAVAVNRATPSGEEILNVFGERIVDDTVILCDGKQSYGILEDKCTVATTKRVNKVNGFHSFIKDRLNAAHGVATKYLNRYNALFAKVYAVDESVVDDIFALMTDQTVSFNTIAHTQSAGLLNI